MRTHLLALAVVLQACASTASTGAVGVAPQYDTTHVYVAPDRVDAFVASFLATFGGDSTPQAMATVTPTPSMTSTQLLHTPAGPVSLFGFTTPIPYPFGSERTGYLVTDLDKAVAAAVAAGASVIVAPFPDAIGHDAIVAWPGGVMMQLYTHNTAPSYPKLATVPENRVYVAADRADVFAKDFTAFAQGRVVSDDAHAPGAELGRRGTYRRIRIESSFGKLVVLATNDGQLPFPYGREVTGYEVADLAATLAAATAAGVKVLVQPQREADREAAMVEFPGGYIAEIHAPLRGSW